METGKPGRPVAAVLEMDLALITKIYIMRGEKGEILKGGQNDVIGVLRVQQHGGSRIRHVRSLNISGQASLSCDHYVGAFGQEGMTLDLLARECAERKPYVRIAWISFPSDVSRIDPEDEQFIKFKISDNFGVFAYPPGEPRDSIGFRSPRVEPKHTITSPVWSLVVGFHSANTDFVGILPTPTDDVKTGAITFTVALDEEDINIPAAKITCPWKVSLNSSYIDRIQPQQLFYGIDPAYGPDKR